MILKFPVWDCHCITSKNQGSLDEELVGNARLEAKLFCAEFEIKARRRGWG